MRFVLATDQGLTIGDFEIARVAAEAMEVLAIAVISIAVVAATVGAFAERFRSDYESSLQTFKRTMAHGLLVGLDLLIAADIIKTVTLEATLENAAVLTILVLLRTFLSWTLVLEVEERWPWQRRSLVKPD
ncbi:MAG: DUF1622 domain-containing protein [Actinomycetota bacterium]|nr:DUF1622 domain-containing protein [Actinomycetota bacterium]